jgi:hypothetical protein
LLFLYFTWGLRKGFGDSMGKLWFALAVLGEVALGISAVLLLQLDNLINGILYNYGLEFSVEWAQPYWFLLRVSLVLIIVGFLIFLLLSAVEFSDLDFQED